MGYSPAMLSVFLGSAYLKPAVTRPAITFVIAIMVVSSPALILVNPASVSGETSGYHPTPQALETLAPVLSSTPTAMEPSTLSQDGDFTTQAALSLTRATQTSNIANSKSYYDIMFRTSTSGIIKTIEMKFPPGTYVGIALLVEAVGIGPGTIAASGSTATGQTITYTVTNAVNVPAGTKIRIELANINNPSVTNNALTTIITTRNSANGIIDGPTATNAFSIKHIGTRDIEDHTITGRNINGIDTLVFGICNIDWGTVLAGEQKMAGCAVTADKGTFEDFDYPGIATQTRGTPGLTLLKAGPFTGCCEPFNSASGPIHVANNTPNDLVIGIVTYGLIVFRCETGPTSPCPGFLGPP